MCNDLRCFSKENVTIRTTKVSLFYLHFKPTILHELHFVKEKGALRNNLRTVFNYSNRNE